MRSTIEHDPDDPRHGTTNGYINLGCRCPRCAEANTDHHYRYMEAHPEQRFKHLVRARLRYERLRRAEP